jgi:Fe-S cluster biogenesis protein NfuA
MVAIRAALFVALSGQCEGASSSVVTMLQMMQNKVTAEGKKEEVLSRSSCAVARLASGI